MRLFSVTVILLCAYAQVSAAPQEANIACAAALTCQPEVKEGGLRYLLDGRVGTGFSFEVGTEGDGWVAFDFGRTRTITGLRFFQHSEIYYTTDYTIEGDADGDGTYELTLAEGSQAKIGDWNERRWEPAQVRVVRLRSVKGVSEGRRAHPCLAEVEILRGPCGEAGEPGRHGRRPAPAAEEHAAGRE